MPIYMFISTTISVDSGALVLPRAFSIYRWHLTAHVEHEVSMFSSSSSVSLLTGSWLKTLRCTSGTCFRSLDYPPRFSTRLSISMLSDLILNSLVLIVYIWPQEKDNCSGISQTGYTATRSCMSWNFVSFDAFPCSLVNMLKYGRITAFSQWSSSRTKVHVSAFSRDNRSIDTVWFPSILRASTITTVDLVKHLN